MLIISASMDIKVAYIVSLLYDSANILVIESPITSIIMWYV